MSKAASGRLFHGTGSNPEQAADRAARANAPIAEVAKDCYLTLMEELFGDPSYKGFVLQDKKRLPARFFARVCGVPTARLI